MKISQKKQVKSKVKTRASQEVCLFLSPNFIFLKKCLIFKQKYCIFVAQSFFNIMTEIDKILQTLKTKTASLGFNEDELKSVAEQISNNLESKEGATDDDINAQIEAVIPILQLAQRNANRVINKASKEPKTPQKSAEKNPSMNDDEPAWFKRYRESAEQRIAELEKQRTITSRTERLNAIVKDSGLFGTRTLNAFKRMNFENEEDFETFLNETQNDLEAYNKERSESGLNIAPLGGIIGNTTKKKEASDDEADAVAKSF